MTRSRSGLAVAAALIAVSCTSPSGLPDEETEILPAVWGRVEAPEYSGPRAASMEAAPGRIVVQGWHQRPSGCAATIIRGYISAGRFGSGRLRVSMFAVPPSVPGDVDLDCPPGGVWLRYEAIFVLPGRRRYHVTVDDGGDRVVDGELDVP